MPQKPTACLALADGTVFYGQGFGAAGEVVAELVFNTAMTGYQEFMTDHKHRFASGGTTTRPELRDNETTFAGAPTNS